MNKPQFGPDALRYLHLANGDLVSRPFNLRWLLPKYCGRVLRRWWIVWLAAWPVLASGVFMWRIAAGDDWRFALAASAVTLGLPGILGPPVVIPVGVDLPATALSVWAAYLITLGHPLTIAAGVVVLGFAACIRETAPVWVALWLLSPWALVALVPVAIRALVAKTGPDPLGGTYVEIAEHPFRTALMFHRHQWRNAWVMLAPWGLCLAALYRPSWQLCLVLVVAHLQLLVATDTVRLVHHAAGPLVAAAAVHVLPPEWLLIAVVIHTLWWRMPERI